MIAIRPAAGRPGITTGTVFLALLSSFFSAPSCCAQAGQVAANRGKGVASSECLQISELNRHWPPPSAQIGFFDEVNHREVAWDFSSVSFNKVTVISAVCGNLRGRGEEAYMALETDETREAERAVLAVLNRATGALELAGPLGPADIVNGELRLDDVNGDGHPEIVFNAPGALDIWGWQNGNWASLLHAASNYPFELRDFQGNGERLLAVWVDPPGVPHTENVRWPGGAFRWTGTRFVQILVPSLYTASVASAESRLANRTSMEFLLALGHAYQILGKGDQAHKAYTRAWDLHQKDSALPRCSAPADAVQDYYDAIGEGDLIRAYQHLGPERQTGFAEFAAGFAQTQSVLLSEPPEAGAESGGVVPVAIKLHAYDVTPQGPLMQDFAGTWRVRKSDCALLGARMHKEPSNRP